MSIISTMIFSAQKERKYLGEINNWRLDSIKYFIGAHDEMQKMIYRALRYPVYNNVINNVSNIKNVINKVSNIEIPGVQQCY